MIKTIYTSSNNHFLNEVIEGFQGVGIHITPVDSGTKALEMMSDTSFKMLITDETLEDMSGKELIEKAVMQNPFISFAVTSSMSTKDFHDAYEGLGVLMQLSCPPRMSDAEKLAEQLGKISGLLEKSMSAGKEI